MIAVRLAIALQAAVLQQGLAKDADVLEHAYTAMHPGLYRYNTPDEVRGHYRVLRAAWAKCGSLPEAYLSLSEFTAKLKCGHTYPNFFNQPREIVDAVFAGNNRLPCYFRWLDGKMVVLKDFTSSHTLPPGTEIDRIDKIDCALILRRLMTIARADGSNDNKRRAYLSVTGDDRYEAFDIYFPLMVKIPAGGFSLDVRDLSGRARTVKVAAVTMEDRVAAWREAARVSGWKLEMHGKTAVMTMPSWEMYDGKWDWQGFLKSSFARLRSEAANTLVIDLRQNEGGSSVGDVLAGYLTRQPITLNRYGQFTRYDKVDPSLRPYLDTWDRSFDDWSAWTLPAAWLAAGRNSFHRMTRFQPKEGDLVQPATDRFEGKVYVLVDGSNSSATFEFENLAQTYHLATLVGEPTGGNLRGINGGAFYFLHLPHSHLEVDLPLIGQFPAAPQPDRGLTPDITMVPQRVDIAAGRDGVLERLLNRIGTGGTPKAYTP